MYFLKSKLHIWDALIAHVLSKKMFKLEFLHDSTHILSANGILADGGPLLLTVTQPYPISLEQ